MKQMARWAAAGMAAVAACAAIPAVADGTATLLGATQGYDENGFAIRGSIPLEAGMKIQPLFTAVAQDGTEREYQGDEITVPADGLTLTWERIPSGSYQYCSYGNAYWIITTGLCGRCINPPNDKTCTVNSVETDSPY